jgi:integrase
MAWLYQRPDSAKWWIGFRKNGRQFLQSTKTTDKKAAEAVLKRFELMEQAEAQGVLNDAFIEALTGKKESATTLKQAATDFLNEAKGTTAKSTVGRYTSILDGLQIHLSASDTRPLLRDVSPDDVRGFLTKRRSVTTARTANLEKKILSSFFRWCIKNQVLKENPVMPLKAFKESAGEEMERRAFSPDEIRTLYLKAPDDFWRYMVVAAFYSGLRLGDLITLKIGEIDFCDNALRLTTGKTNRRMIIPMAVPLRKLLAKLTESVPVNNPNRYLWPEQAPRYEKHGSNVFSNEFYKFLLVPAGLAPKRTHAKAKQGRGAKRDSANVSFHSLRHSFVSYLKATGSNPAVARELAGHSSDLINNLYTHIPQSTLSDAIAKLPEVTK